MGGPMGKAPPIPPTEEAALSSLLQQLMEGPRPTVEGQSPPGPQSQARPGHWHQAWNPKLRKYPKIGLRLEHLLQTEDKVPHK